MDFIDLPQMKGSTPLLVAKRPQKDLTKNVLFKIFNFLTIDEMFLMSKVCKHWNKSFIEYLETNVFNKKSFGFCLSMDQLPKIYRQCLNANESDIIERWSCADVNHESGDGKLVRHLQNCKEPDSSLSIILENSPELQSLDLRGLTLDLHFLKRINDYCPDLECLHLNAVKMDSKAFIYFSKKIVPKVVHLSIDNMFEVTDFDNQELVWNQLFRRSRNLTDLKLDIFPMKSQFESTCLRQLCGGLVFLHLNLYSNSDKTNPIKLKDLFESLTEGLGRSIRFLRLYSEEENIDNDSDLLNPELNKFSDLEAINLSLKSKKHFQWFYQSVSEVSNLDSLTLNLNNLEESQEILYLFLNSELKLNINRLKLENVVISDEFCDFLKTDYKNLVSFQIIDVYFENNDSFIEFLEINDNISYLVIQFSSQSTGMAVRHDVLSESKFLDYISSSNHLNELDLINCKQIDSNTCRQKCEQKGIEFYNKIYS